MQLLYVLLLAWARARAPIAVTDGPLADRSRPAALEKVGVQNGVSLHDSKKGRMQASHRRPKETPPRSTPVIHDKKQDELQRVQRVEGADAAKMFGVARTDYAPWVLHPEQINAMAHTLVLTGERSDSHGHVVLLRQLTKLVGLHDPELMGGLDTSRRLEAAGKPFVMMTLTNDHLPSSEKDHDRALNWERANCTASAWDAIFIGPPGSSMLEGPRKSWFCEQSEMLAWETGNPWNRFTLPCATRQTPYDHTQYRTAFEALLSQPAALAKVQPPSTGPPRFLTRVTATKAVVANGVGMSTPKTVQQLTGTPRSIATSLERANLLLVQYLDPPLLAHGVHLGVPVRTRIEARIHGLVQWEPLRIWAALHVVTSERLSLSRHIVATSGHHTTDPCPQHWAALLVWWVQPEACEALTVHTRRGSLSSSL